MSEGRGIFSAAQESTGGPSRAAGRGVPLFIAAAACFMLLPLIWAWGESPLLLVGGVVALIAILTAAAGGFLWVASPASIARPVEGRAESVSTPNTEKVFVVFAFLFYAGAFWRTLLGLSDVDQQGSVPGTIASNVLWALLYLTAFVLLRYRCVIPKGLWRAGLPMLLPVPVAVLSLIWSDDRLLTFLRCGGLVGTTVVAAYVALRYTLRDILRLLAWTLGIAAVGSFFVALFVPSFGIGTGEYEGLWIGAFTHKNGLGSVMAIAFLLALLFFWDEKSHKALWFSLAVFSIFLVLKADSMTSLAICFAMPCLLWVSTKSLLEPARVATRLLYFFLGASMLAGIVFLQFGRILQILGRDSDLTGRTILWAAAWGAVIQKPYLGYGYEAFWRGFEGASADLWSQFGPSVATQSHNGFLEILLGLGLVGFVSVMIALASFAKGALQFARHETKAPESVWPWAFLMYLFLSNLLESNLMKSNNLPWLLYMITALSLSLNQLQRLTKQDARGFLVRVRAG